METWILVVFLASSKTLDAGITGINVGLFANAAQCKSAANVVAENARNVSSGNANAVCVQTTHRSYSK